MKKYRICIIGAGNISNSRHIPALRKNENAIICGVISNDLNKVEKTKKKYPFIENTLVIEPEIDIKEQLSNCQWFVDSVDAVIIGTPPTQHYIMSKICLELGKHVLVEKPMAMNAQETKELNCLANEKNLVLYVMHSFQYASGMIRLSKLVEEGKLGKIASILELQLTNRNRRLPLWYNDLPLGLFYDEAAHFFYCANRFGGELKVLNAKAQFNEKEERTPLFLQVQLKAGNIPVQMYMNFNSPICEWGLILLGEDKIAIYDYFKDILVVLKNDNQHLAKEVLRNALSFTLQYWRGFIKNGFMMFTGSLLYGHDLCINNFLKSIETGDNCYELSGELGEKVVKAMNEVVELVNQ